MADHCLICNTRRPEGGTNHLVLNGGETWIEFCGPCGEAEVIYNVADATQSTVAALFRGEAPVPVATGACSPLPPFEPVAEDWDEETQEYVVSATPAGLAQYAPQPATATLADFVR